MKTIIIAEAGVNHNGNMELAKKLVDKAKEAGADFVKFQAFKTENLVSQYAQKAEYQKQTTDPNESQFQMIKKLELSEEQHIELQEYCSISGIKYLSSPFDLESVDLLDRMNIEIMKIPSGEITNLPYLKKIGQMNKPVIVSTGMADLNEVGDMLKVFDTVGLKKEMITVLHCNTEYPTPMMDVNLKAMNTIRDEFDVNVGYSDHTEGIEVAIAAVALGATVIEKHFTLDKEMEGPDHRASLDPDELKKMILGIRNIESALGDGVKKPSASEFKNRDIVRKSIVAATEITEGDTVTEQMLAIKRPGDGISPMEIEKVIGMISNRNYKKDELIKL